MEQRVTNFRRFYAAFNRLTIHGEPEETRRQLVLQYTDGRTDSLREVSRKEYAALCAALEDMNGTRDELRRCRSIALRLMQELGVETTDWAQINDFCRHPRIAGKAFGRLSVEELGELTARLRSIRRKGWQREHRPSGDTEPRQTGRMISLISLSGIGEA